MVPDNFVDPDEALGGNNQQPPGLVDPPPPVVPPPGGAGLNNPEPVVHPPARLTLPLQLPEKFGNTAQQAVRDWFDSFDLAATAVNWTPAMKASYLGLFLTGSPLTVWRTQCSRVDYDAAKALLVKTFDGTPHPDMAWRKFNAYQWDRKMPILEFVANAQKLLSEYNGMLPPDRQLSPDAAQSLLIDKVTEFASGGARAELRRTRPTTLQDACDLLAVYSDDAPIPPAGAVAAVGPFENRPADNERVRDEMVLKAISDNFARGFEKVTDVLSTVVKQIQSMPHNQRPALPPPQQQGTPAGGKGRPRPNPGRGSCGICRQQGHGTLSCPFKKFDNGCALCGQDGHLARACPRNPFIQLANINTGSSGGGQPGN